jgi:hypothetical protein
VEDLPSLDVIVLAAGHRTAHEKIEPGHVVADLRAVMAHFDHQRLIFPAPRSALGNRLTKLFCGFLGGGIQRPVEQFRLAFQGAQAR